MMYRSAICISAMASLLITAPIMATEEKGEKKVEYHCETTKDGKHVDLPDVKDRQECKKQGGKWKKKHDEGHQHAEGEEHKDDE